MTTTSPSYIKNSIKNRNKRIEAGLRIKPVIIPGLDYKGSWIQHMFHLQDGIYYEKRCAICNIVESKSIKL